MSGGQTSKNTFGGNTKTTTGTVNNTQKFDQKELDEAKQNLKLLKEKLGTNMFGGENISVGKTTSGSNGNYRKPFQPAFDTNKGNFGVNSDPYGGGKSLGTTGTYGNKTVVKNTVNTKTTSQPKMTNKGGYNNNFGGDEYEDTRPLGKQGGGYDLN
jgi:hypothetical protein